MTLGVGLNHVDLRQFAIRLSVVMAALGVLYLRTSITFHAPQMWGEDVIFFLHAKTQGWKTLMIPEAGYLSFMQSFTAFASLLFKDQSAVKIYFWVSIALTLLVVWLVTSPRLELPYKPVLALAVVLVPMGFEEIGTITNIQWILPIGGVAILFMRPPDATLTGTAAEALYLLVMALSGPFSIFMAPMFAAMSVRQVGAARKRLIFLGAAVSVGAGVQVYFIISLIHQDLGIRPTTYPWELWFTLPARQILTVFPGLSDYVSGPFGVLVAVMLLGLAAVASFTGPYRDQKRCMILLALAIAVGGMLKFRVALDTQTFATRYFYAGSIFVLWILCCVSKNKVVQRAAVLIVVATEIALLPVVASTPRTEDDFKWPSWARQINSGLPIIIPTAPAGWYTQFPASPDGPLHEYSGWMGRKLPAIAPVISPVACAGDLDDLVQLPKLGSRTPWGASGSLGDAEHPHTAYRFVVLVDDEDRVTGFGYKGFSRLDPVTDGGTTGWQSVFFAEPRRTLRAYAVDAAGILCRLGSEVSFSGERKPTVSGTPVDAVPLVAGRRITQRLSASNHPRSYRVTFVTWGKEPDSYWIGWHAAARHTGEVLQLGSGRIDAGSVRDWQTVALPTSPLPDGATDEIEFTFEVNPDVDVSVPAGLPLVMSADGGAKPADVDGQPSPSGGSIGLSAVFDH